VHSTVRLGGGTGPRRNITIPFGVEILDGKKKTFEDMYNRLDTLPACDGQTDRQTDDGRTYILPRHSPRYAYVSRGKNWSGSVGFAPPHIELSANNNCRYHSSARDIGLTLRFG